MFVNASSFRSISEGKGESKSTIHIKFGIESSNYGSVGTIKELGKGPLRINSADPRSSLSKKTCLMHEIRAFLKKKK